MNGYLAWTLALAAVTVGLVVSGNGWLLAGGLPLALLAFLGFGP